MIYEGNVSGLIIATMCDKSRTDTRVFGSANYDKVRSVRALQEIDEKILNFNALVGNNGN